MPRKPKHIVNIKCPVEASLNVIGGKWKTKIIFLLTQVEKRRFNELRKLLPDVSQRMLTNQLRELEEDKIIHRKVYPEVPPRVEYSLTELGYTLKPVLSELAKWGQEFIIGNNSDMDIIDL